MLKKLKEKFCNYYIAQLILVAMLVVSLSYGQYKIYNVLVEIHDYVGDVFVLCQYMEK
ncbi:hypothetical protein LCGC14_1595720 [marine sediment metagenome]|uniref:Uncharacterized protein n=1 Tax=marine sediment metagenome TaxID=412755 RepID=A0A0F9ICP7_9ZZZZ